MCLFARINCSLTSIWTIDSDRDERHMSGIRRCKPNESTPETDSHADTCCIGESALIIRDYNRPVTVLGYDPALGAKQYNTVSAVLDFRHPVTGQRYHLVVHQAFNIPHLDHHLLCPMQCRVNDVEVDECPKHLSKNPTVKTHEIVASADDGSGEVILPLALKHVTLYLTVYKPTEEEWESHEQP